MPGLKVLITNNTLGNRAGTELYVRDLATALLDRGHSPVAYSQHLGNVAEDLRKLSIPVISDLNRLTSAPDIIHGHHHLETMTALLQFPRTPALYVCHGWLPWEELPPHFSRIRRYVAVDEACLDRLVVENDIPEEKVELLLNFVDLDRFKRREPLPPKPGRALIFSNNIHEGNFLPTIRRACEKAGIALDIAGLGAGKPASNPENILGNYDLIFAKGRSALEALAVGCAVITCDLAGLGPMVTTDNIDRLRRLNFGIRAIRHQLTVENLSAEIAKYNAADSAAVSGMIRATAGREKVIDHYLRIYQEIIKDYSESDPACFESEMRQAAAYIQQISPDIKTFIAGSRAHIHEMEMQKKSRTYLLKRMLLSNRHFSKFYRSIFTMPNEK